MSVKIVAYTTNQKYKEESERLRLSLEALELEHEILHLDQPALGWKEAVCMKPKFIADQMLRNLNYDILYTDADSAVNSVPLWSTFTNADFAYHKFQRTMHHLPEMLTGTLFFKNSAKVRAFVQEWGRITPHYKDTMTPDQDSMKAAYLLWQHHLEVVDFGPAHCFVFDEFRTHYPDVRPIVEHFQASRRLRK